MQLGFYFDQARCTGCHICIARCKKWHRDTPNGLANLLIVPTKEKGKYLDTGMTYMFVPCYHCAEPPCVPACPVGAITKREEDGVVVVDSETCLGKDNCELCREACPYDVPQFETGNNARMHKCDLCLDRLAEEKSPICVEVCPLRALDAGPLDELKAKYGDRKEVKGFVYSPEAKPSIITMR